MNTSAEKLFLKPSVCDPSDFVKALGDKAFNEIDFGFGEILKEAYSIVTETMDGQLLEIYLDRKCIEKSVELAKKSGDDFSEKLAVRMAVLANIKIALRCKSSGKDGEFIMNALADIPAFDKKALCEAALEDRISSFVSSLGFEKLSESVNLGSAAFEKTCDDMLIDMVKDAKYKCLGISPLVAYYFATDAEVKTVRIVLSCKKNGIDNEIIRERVRVLYV